MGGSKKMQQVRSIANRPSGGGNKNKDYRPRLVVLDGYLISLEVAQEDILGIFLVLLTHALQRKLKVIIL